MEIYRGVFDYPRIGSKNLLHDPDSCAKCRKSQECNKLIAEPPSTSKHVVQFMGWGTGKKPQYLGRPAGRVLAQEAKWEQLWLRKGQYEDARQRERQAEKESVSASEPAIS